MKRSKLSDEQILAVVREGEAGHKVADLCWTHGITSRSLRSQGDDRVDASGASCGDERRGDPAGGEQRGGGAVDDRVVRPNLEQQRLDRRRELPRECHADGDAGSGVHDSAADHRRHHLRRRRLAWDHYAGE
jgi:hypothetical protein